MEFQRKIGISSTTLRPVKHPLSFARWRVLSLVAKAHAPENISPLFMGQIWSNMIKSSNDGGFYKCRQSPYQVELDKKKQSEVDLNGSGRHLTPIHPDEHWPVGWGENFCLKLKSTKHLSEISTFAIWCKSPMPPQFSHGETTASVDQMIQATGKQVIFRKSATAWDIQVISETNQQLIQVGFINCISICFMIISYKN